MKIYISPDYHMLIKADEQPVLYDNVNKKKVFFTEATKEQIGAFFRGVKVSEKQGDKFFYYDYDNARYFRVYCQEHKVDEYSKRFYGSDKRVDITEEEYRSNIRE